jgi:adenylate kinase family enzyme
VISEVSRVLIFGNSGSGKSTLARELCESGLLAHLDLDTLAWKPASPPEREKLGVSARAIERFTASKRGWVIEGCYADLLELAVPQSTELIFMNFPVELCIANARLRPWEPHKYESKYAQDANLPMLIEWIGQYPERDNTFSFATHSRMYEKYVGKKRMYTDNERNV